MRIRVPVPCGTLKFKTYRYLRSAERDRRVPVVKIGSVYVSWWAKGSETSSPAEKR